MELCSFSRGVYLSYDWSIPPAYDWSIPLVRLVMGVAWRTQTVSWWYVSWLWFRWLVCDGCRVRLGLGAGGWGPLDLLRWRQVGPLGVVGFGEIIHLPDRFCVFYRPEHLTFNTEIINLISFQNVPWFAEFARVLATLQKPDYSSSHHYQTLISIPSDPYFTDHPS